MSSVLCIGMGLVWNVLIFKYTSKVGFKNFLILQAEFYGDIATCCKHIGLDDSVPGEYKPHMTLASERLLLGRKGKAHGQVKIKQANTLYIKKFILIYYV